MDNGREFQLFGPKYKVVSCLIFVRQKYGLYFFTSLVAYVCTWPPVINRFMKEEGSI